MKHPFHRAGFVGAASVLLAGTMILADGTRFSDYTPLASSVTPAIPVGDEDTPITFGNRVGQHSASHQRQRPDDRNHDSERLAGIHEPAAHAKGSHENREIRHARAFDKCAGVVFN